MYKKHMTRRSAMKAMGGGVALTASATMGFPAIVRAEKPVKVGFVTALTGIEAILGVPQLNMFEMAAEEINETGGINGRKLEYIVEDTQTSTRVTVEKMRKVIHRDGVDAVLGLIATTELAAAQTVTEPVQKLLFFPIYYPGAECWPYTIFVGQVAEQQIVPLMPYLTERWPRHYVMGSDFSWGQRSSKVIEAQLKKLGGEFLGTDFYPFGIQDLGPAYQKAKQVSPDAIWLFFGGSDQVTAVRQYHDFGMEAQRISDGWDEVFLTSLPPKPQTGIISSQSYYDVLDNPTNKAFVARYRKKFGADKRINATMEDAYISVHLYARAVAKAGTTDTGAVLKALPQIEFDAPQGATVRIHAKNNHTRLSSIMAQVNESGNFDILKHYGAIDPIVPGCDLT